jgi:hypothetical protein
MSRIIDLYDKASAALKRGDAAQWEAAEAMADLYALGESQRQIGERLERNQSTVSIYLKIWHKYDPARHDQKPPPSFSEALGELRDYSAEWAQRKSSIPKTPEKRAELVADLLKDKAVADAPVVREVEERHAGRRLKAEAASFNREHGIPTRAQTERDDRRLSVLQGDTFWARVAQELTSATRAVNEATGEVERTGLPRSRSGDLIKQARALARAVERFEQAATAAGIGQAM